MIEVIVSGVVSGFLYAIAGLGLVAVYRTSRVINFALGGIGGAATYIVSGLLNHALPYGWVFPIAIVLGAILGLLVELGVARPLRRLPPLTVAVGTLGALLIFEGILGAKYGYSPQAVSEALGGAGTLRIGSVAISANQLLIIGVGIMVTILLLAVMYRTRLGLTMRATSSGPQTSELLGVNVSRTRMWAWMIGGAYGALAALLFSPLTYLTPDSFTTFLLTAFAAVVLGGFTSITGVVIGSLVFGIAINLLEVYLNSTLVDVYTFVGIALVLVFRPYGIFGRREHEIPEPDVSGSVGGANLALELMSGPVDADGAVDAEDANGTVDAESAVGTPRGDAAGVPERPAVEGRRQARFAPSARYSLWLVVLIVLAALPLMLGNADTFLMATALATFIGVLGLNVLVGYSGQVSLGQTGFLLIGAITAAIAVHHGVTPLESLPIALVVGALAGVIVGLPGARLSGLYLVLLTLTFSVAIPELDLQLQSLTGGSNGLPLPLPSSVTAPANQYWFVLAVAASVTVVTMVVANTRLGRGWRAVRDSEPAARALGMRPLIIKLGAFAWGSAFAALGGALTAMLVGFVSPGTYDVYLAIYALLAVVLGGGGSIFGSLIGALFITLIPSYTSTTGTSADIIFGAVMLIVLIVAPSGVVGLLQKLAARVRIAIGGRGPRRAAPAREPSRPHPEVPSSVAPGQLAAVPPGDGATGLHGHDEDGLDGQDADALLVLRDVSSGYGAVNVLHAISMEVRRGEVVAVVGANGVGKSTLLRTVSGLVAPSQGTISWRGHELARRLAPHRVTRLGISHVPEGRAIFPDLTVSENLTMGTFGAAGRTRASGSPGMSRDDVLARFPVIGERAGQRAGTLSGGQQQMLAIGRALVGQPELLMLDEPSLGLAPVTAEQVFEILREISRAGVAVLLVEQNAEAALALADRAYVISRGRVALHGTGEQLRNDERIRHTYLELGAV